MSSGALPSSSQVVSSPASNEALQEMADSQGHLSAVPSSPVFWLAGLATWSSLTPSLQLKELALFFFLPHSDLEMFRPVNWAIS